MIGPFSPLLQEMLEAEIQRRDRILVELEARRVARDALLAKVAAMKKADKGTKK